MSLENKSFYVFGAHPKKSDIILRHESISRVHSGLLIDKDIGVVVLDLMSKAGTKLDGAPCSGCIPYTVKNGQKIHFGLSTRTYIISIDYTKMQRAIETEKKNLEREMKLLEKLDDPDIDIETLKSTLGLIKEDTIYVSNLPYSCVEKDLQDLFGDCGKILSIRMPENRQTKQNRGFAFITMETEKAARKAINYDGHKFYDRKLKVTKAEKKAEIEDKRIKDEETKKDWNKDKVDDRGDRKQEDNRRRDQEKKKWRSRSRSGERRRDGHD